MTICLVFGLLPMVPQVARAENTPGDQTEISPIQATTINSFFADNPSKTCMTIKVDPQTATGNPTIQMFETTKDGATYTENQPYQYGSSN